MNAVVDRADLQKTTGQRIREYREKRGITQTALAAAIGIHQVSLSRIENGVTLPEWDILCNLAEALGVPVDKFRKKI